MEEILFSNYKDRILAALQAKPAGTLLPDSQGYTILDGFLNIPISDKIGGPLIVGGPSLPTVAVIGNSTGLIQYFALKSLIPDLKF